MPRPSPAKRHLADLRARSGLTTEQLIYAGRAAGGLVVPSLEPQCAAGSAVRLKYQQGCDAAPSLAAARIMVSPSGKTWSTTVR